ncbi:zinc finger domain-containing protein [Streptomyces canus]|uniref:zinc finger domain-containing protein n=1 Tax=Streptomyces canus TaxID=58343 RepID=UPI0040385C39
MSSLRRTSSRQEVRTLACPQCGAVAGRPCRDPAGTSRYVNHRQRVAAFHADRYRSTPGPQIGGQSRLQPRREQVRTVPCPRCSAPAYAPCTGARGRERTAHHFERVEAFTASY